MTRARKSTPTGSALAQDRPSKSLESEALRPKTAQLESAATAALASSSAYVNQTKAESYKMDDREKGAFQGVSEIAAAFFSSEGAKKIAALSIETSERLAKSVLDFQAKASEWAKDTPFAAMFEAQNAIGHKFVELSVDAARRLWRVDESRAA
jgi:DNA-binding IclR family transcriptional regulator